ncbi:hypothetical protein GGR16_001706 [Chelatococcus caeni]|uniref:Uncharacterized protein n=1 Tax=Chelatococcus caeni TaxID=1348468 RepID=A0A840BUN1_9HYPH|nr:hypothetical protein [Chelatococcus caeni]MBB4016700.1 hypothetical protein [Chelatococcus caeni]
MSDLQHAAVPRGWHTAAGARRRRLAAFARFCREQAGSFELTSVARTSLVDFADEGAGGGTRQILRDLADALPPDQVDEVIFLLAFVHGDRLAEMLDGGR